MKLDTNTKKYYNIFIRKTFYDLIWTKPISHLSIEFRISSSDIRKLCKYFKIPLPTIGFWQKKKHHKLTAKLPLPDYIEKENEEIKLVFRKKGDKDIPYLISPFKQRVFDLKNSTHLNFKVPTTLNNPNILIVKTRNKLKELDSLKENKYFKRNNYYEILPIHTDKKLRNRALRIMNTIVSVVYQLGHSVVFEYSRCHIIMFGQITEINLRQKYHRIRKKNKHGWSTQSWVKSNKLEFQAGPSFRLKNWIDSDKKKLEEFIPEIITWIEFDCKYWHDLRENQAKQALVQKKQKEIEEEKIRIVELENQRRNDLIIDSQQWHKATILRNYIDAVKNDSKDASLNKKDNWFSWADSVADSMDPLKPKYQDVAQS